MASITAKLNKVTSWTSAGISDTCTCSDISSQFRNGVQLEVDGASVENLTILVTMESGATKTVAAPSGSGEACLIGEGFSMTAIAISNAAAGTYSVKFSQ